MGRAICALRWASLLPMGALLGACGFFGGSQPSHALRSNAYAPQPLDPVAKALAAMVDAVSSAQAPVELKFSIRNRPQVGQDDEVDYALIPEIPGIETLRVVFGARDGLQVTEHGPPVAGIKPASGTPIFGSVTIRPLKTGVFTLTAIVGVQSPSESVGWPFRIPVIAAEGPAQTAANRP